MIPAIQQGFLLEVAGYLLFARTGPSTDGLTELGFTIPKNPALAGLQLYIQTMIFSARTGHGAFCDSLGLKIRK